MKLLALGLGEMLGRGVTELTDFHGAHRAEILAGLLHFLLNFVLDRQAVAIPTGNIGCLVPFHRPEAQDDILESLVDEMPDMDIAIGEGRAIVQHPLAFAVDGAVGEHLFIQPCFLPHRQAFRLICGELGLHGECGLGEVQGRLVIFLFGGFGGHGFFLLLIIQPSRLLGAISGMRSSTTGVTFPVQVRGEPRRTQRTRR